MASKVPARKNTVPAKKSAAKKTVIKKPVIKKTVVSDIKPLSREQQYFVDTGRQNAERLADIVKSALGIKTKKYEVKRHTWIYSPPGAGKTFTIQNTADAAKAQMVKVQGAASMNAFITRIATAVYCANGKQVIVWIDDCDTLFMDEKGLNVMKGALDEERNVLAWNVNMTNQILTYEKSENENDQIKAAALRYFQTPGGVGIEIPTDNVRFIVSSNKNLCAPADVGSKGRTKKVFMHEAAVRDRVNYEEFELTPEKSWGWVAAVLLNSNILDLSKAQKHILLDWMWTNWKRLPANSMRAVKDYAAMMLNHPEEYPNYWDSTLRNVG